jgi:hypothetical protein
MANPEDIEKEFAYRLDERRGMIAGSGPLTDKQEAQARKEASESMQALEDWEKERGE